MTQYIIDEMGYFRIDFNFWLKATLNSCRSHFKLLNF